MSNYRSPIDYVGNANYVYSIEPVKEFRVDDKCLNYVIDVPQGRWDKAGTVAVVKFPDHSGLYQSHLPKQLRDGDLLRLPNLGFPGSWLEVSMGDDCFGYEGNLFGLLKLLKEERSILEEIKEIQKRGGFRRTIVNNVKNKQ